MASLLHNFIFHNHSRLLTLHALALAAQMRALLFFVPIPKLHPYLGVEGEESPTEELTAEQKRTANRIAYRVNRVAARTPWQSKCLVRALVAQKLLYRHGLASTLYLGVGKGDDGKMVAHAWIRAGTYGITGESDRAYAVVTRFAKYPRRAR